VDATTDGIPILVPTDNAMPMDAALAWSRQDDLAQVRRRAEAAALPARATPVVKLEDSSDDDLYRPMSPRFGDAGLGSSRWTPGQSSQPSPQDDAGDSSDDDSGNYTRFYRHFGM
jgi:hypothetical protein